MSRNNEQQILKIEFFRASNGLKPAADFLKSLRDSKAAAAIKAHLNEMSTKGLFGDIKPLHPGSGLSEIRFFLGAAYRVYFAPDFSKNALIVFGMSDKSKFAQDTEIKKCIDRRIEYMSRTKEVKTEVTGKSAPALPKPSTDQKQKLRFG